MPRKEKTTPAPEDKSTVKLEERFLERLLLAFLIVMAISWMYNGYSRLVVEADAEESIAEATTGDSIGQSAAMGAYDTLSSPHYFANFTEARTALPQGIPTAEQCDGLKPGACFCEALPLCCQSGNQWSETCVEAAILAGQTEENLLGATAKGMEKQTLDKITWESKGANEVKAILRGKGQAKEKEAIRAAHPEFALFVELNTGQFQPNQTSRDKALKCREYPLCLSAYINSKQPVLRHYLALRHANAAELPVDEASVLFLRQHLSVFLRAFQLDKVDGDKAITTSDISLLKGLLEIRNNASRNGILFSIHLTLAALLIGLFRWLSPRFVPKT